MAEISCRPAEMADMDLLYNWVNESAVRRNSFNSKPITYSEHKKWFSHCLSEKSCEIYIFYLSDIPLGQVRLNYSDGNAVIDYSIDQKYRGQNYGKIIIGHIEGYVRKKHPEIIYMISEVKFDNIASQKVFEDNEYSPSSNEDGVFRYCKNLNKTTYTMFRTQRVIHVDRARDGEKVLLLTNNRNALDVYDYLSECGETVLIYSGILTVEQLCEIDPKFVISYNYNYIIPSEILNNCRGKAINMHISYLPYNRGFSPNFWSFIDDTPKGVTIHEIDAHLDTGDIICQESYVFDENNETFRTTYDKLNAEIVSLFRKNWKNIQSGAYSPIKQIGKGTYHNMNDLKVISEKCPLDWDDNIAEYKKRLFSESDMK